MYLKVIKAIPFIILFFLFGSCNKDYYSVGIEIFDDQFEDLQVETFPIFSYQESMDKVQTNNLSNVHLGSYNDSFFGKINSSFISQLDISSFEFFGDLTQDQENNGSELNFINENEQLTAVYLDLPFFNNTNDKDNDGVIDLYDVDPNNSSSDSDNDGLSDILETQAGTNPLSADTDNDGILDPDDPEINGYNADRQVYEIDSIFGNRNADFNLEVYELTYHLSSLDPANNFESFKEYYSDDDFYEKGFYGRKFYDDKVSLDLNDIPVFFKEDDPSTEDIDELNEIDYFETPRIRVSLDKDYFQRAIVNKEGTEDLQNPSNFNNNFRGLIVKASNFSDDLYMLLDILNARLVFEYEYDTYNNNGTSSDLTDDFTEIKEKTSIIPLGGVTINLFDHKDFNQQITNEINLSKDNIPSKKLYVNGSKFISKLKLFTSDNSISDDLLELKSKNILINEANIVLHLDQNIHQENYQYLPNRLYLYSYNNGEPIEDYNKDFTIDYEIGAVNTNKYLFGGFLQYDTNNNPTSYKFNITNHVSNIIRHDSLNIDLGLTLTSNIENSFVRKAYTSDLNRVNIPDASISVPFPVALYGSNVDENSLSNKLKLEVIYSEY